MKLEDYGFYIQYAGEKIHLAGGLPVRGLLNNATKATIDDVNTVRFKFMIVSVDIYNETNDTDTSVIGECELYIDNDRFIRALVNITLKTKYRKCGYGKTIIKEILSSTETGLHIFDVKKPAKSFWSKMGIIWNDDKTTEKKLHGLIAKP